MERLIFRAFQCEMDWIILLSKAGATYSSGTAMAVPAFLLNNRFQFWVTCPQNCW